MPLYCYSDISFPEWSELDFVRLIQNKKGEVMRLRQKSSKEKLFVGEGECELFVNGMSKALKKGEYLELNNPGTEFGFNPIENCTLIHIGGRWSEETGSCGVFTMNNSAIPKNIGDPTNYPRETNFDNHYHDCDEYWIIFKGLGIAVSEGIKYQLKPGAILATRAGDHHDLLEVLEEIHGVWFETSLIGKKRIGHLWAHTHGKPELSIKGRN